MCKHSTVIGYIRKASHRFLHWLAILREHFSNITNQCRMLAHKFIYKNLSCIIFSSISKTNFYFQMYYILNKNFDLVNADLFESIKIGKNRENINKNTREGSRNVTSWQQLTDLVKMFWTWTFKRIYEIWISTYFYNQHMC